MSNNNQKVISFPLGNYPKSATTSIPKSLDFTELQANRTIQYQLQNNMRSILQHYNKSFQNNLKCLRTRITSKVSVNISDQYKKASYSGLKKCGSVWICPVCASKIQQERRKEVAKAFHYAYSNDYKVIMVTLTAPHTKADNLQDLRAKQAIALSKLKSGNSFTLFCNRNNFQGMIRSLEVTHGNNGWHLHTHEAWIVDKDADADLMKKYILNKWTNACKKAGLIPSIQTKAQTEAFNKHAVDILDNCKSSDYFNKQSDTHLWSEDEKQRWGIDKEIANSSSKRSHGSGKSPFELLADNSVKSQNFFIEYAHVMKGQRQLYWSKGLKEAVGINEKTDEEIAETEDKSSTLALLDSAHWNVVLAEKARAEILAIAENESIQGLQTWFADRGHILKAPTQLDIIQNDCITKTIRQRKTDIKEHYNILKENDLKKEKWLDMSSHLTSNRLDLNLLT